MATADKGTPARRPRTRAAGTAARKTDATPGGTVRMYRHGLGDCFLLTFPRKGKPDFRVLIDCGLIQGTPAVTGQPDPLKKVVEDLAETAGADTPKPTIDVLVATHEHWDHVSGFATRTADFDGFDFKEVWLAWTEDPKHPVAAKLRRERAEKVKALKLGLDHARDALGVKGLAADKAAGHQKEVVDELDRVAEVLSFFGVDPASGAGLDATADGDDLFGAAGRPKLTVGEAMGWCRNHPKVKFWKPGEVIPLSAGLRVYVLGPPTDPRQLLKDLPTKKGRETYEEEGHGLAAAAQAFFGADLDRPGAAADRAFERSAPFDEKYRVGMKDAAGIDFYRTHYFGTGAGVAEDWRRIDHAGLAPAAGFALQLDSDTNNTSLALAFELGDPGAGRVLLFPGDAQVGNWESWHAGADGKAVEWRPAGKDGPAVTAKDLLARTVLYKVGHHGSHNATLRAKGLELMTHPGLVALVPVDEYVAHEKKHWERMPFVPLMDALRRRADGRVITADRALKDMPRGVRFPGKAEDAKKKQITVEGPNQVPVTRPLYVDYTLPEA